MSSQVFFFLFVPILAFILLAINFIFAPHNPYQEKDSAFECGFSSFLGQNRTQFSISFFIFALLFLLFDLEILLVYPYLVSAYTNEIYGLAILLVFLLALTLGFAFELGKKALSIDSRQTPNKATNVYNTSVSLVSLSLRPRSGLHVGAKRPQVASNISVSSNRYTSTGLTTGSFVLGPIIVLAYVLLCNYLIMHMVPAGAGQVQDIQGHERFLVLICLIS